MAITAVAFHVCSGESQFQSVRSASPGEGREWREKGPEKWWIRMVLLRGVTIYCYDDNGDIKK